MGCFAFICQDTGRPTYSNNDAVPEKFRQTVHMVDPRDGTDYVERSYGDYGEYGGRDYYELMADLNFEVIKSVYGKWHMDIDELFSKDWKSLTKEEFREKRSIGVDIYFDSWSPTFDLMEEPEACAELEKSFNHLRGQISGFEFPSEWDSQLNRHKRALDVRKQLLYPIIVEDYSRWTEFAKKGCVSKQDPNQITVHPKFREM